MTLEERLLKRAKEKREFVAHAEANRDDWFATMPPEVSADAIRDAELDEEAAAELQRLKSDTVMDKPLDSGMDNVLAWKLGEVAGAMGKIPREQVGDPIDAGLILCRLLREAGFALARHKEQKCQD